MSAPGDPPLTDAQAAASFRALRACAQTAPSRLAYPTIGQDADGLVYLCWTVSGADGRERRRFEVHVEADGLIGWFASHSGEEPRGSEDNVRELPPEALAELVHFRKPPA